MGIFTSEQLRSRAFDRAAWVLRHYWEEQRDDAKGEARVHSRLFDPLVPDCHITIGTSKNGGGHKEHLVPCVVLRNRAFSMYREGKSEKNVAEMLEKFLRIAKISKAEAYYLDHGVFNGIKLKTAMPVYWNWDTGSVMARLEAAGIELV